MWVRPTRRYEGAIWAHPSTIHWQIFDMQGWATLKVLLKIPKNKNGECEEWRNKANKMPTEEVSLRKELNSYDKGLGKGARGQESAPDKPPLRSPERNAPIMTRDSSWKASRAFEIISTIPMRWTSTVSLKKHETPLLTWVKPEDKPSSRCKRDDTDALRHASKCSQAARKDSLDTAQQI